MTWLKGGVRKIDADDAGPIRIVELDLAAEICPQHTFAAPGDHITFLLKKAYTA